MAVLLGSIGATKKKYKFAGYIATDSYVDIYQFLHKTNPENNKFYLVYNLLRDGRFLKGLSPIYEGTYEEGKFVKPITKWIESIGQNPNAQYSYRYTNEYKRGDFSRGYKAKK